MNFTYQPAFPIDNATGLPQNFDFTRLDADIVDRDFFANNLGNDQREVGQISLRLKADLGFAELLSTSAYDSITQSSRGDQFPYTAASSINPAPPFPFFDGTQTQFVDVETFSQELRLTSTDDSALRWMIGGYYLTTDRFISSTTGDDLEQGIVEIRRTADFNPSNPINSFFGDDNDNEAWAIFANIDYAVTDRLELAFAGRYDEDSREQTVSNENGFYANGALVGTAGNPGGVNEETFSEFQPKVTARYLVTDTASIYGSWGRGFRSGQFNQNGVGAAAAAAGINGIQDLLDEEVTETFEVGFKSNWGGLIDFNAALYSTDVENAPYFVFIGAVGAQVLVPIEEVSIEGGEVELNANVGDNLDVYMGVSVSNSEIDEYSVNPGVIGNDAPYVPNSTFNAGFQYRKPITENLGFFARADYENRGRQFWDPENSTARSSIELLGLRAGIEDNDGTWSLIGSVANATDEEYNSEWVAGGFAHSGAPRQYKVDLRYNF